jgi:hypothetical protein
LRALLDVNNDGYPEYTFARSGKIAYRDADGMIAFAPPVMSEHEFERLLTQEVSDSSCRIGKEIVLTASQFKKVKRLCPKIAGHAPSKSYVWLNAPRHGRIYEFEACCWQRGTIRGTSVIPPNKLRELLPSKGSLENSFNSFP